MPTIRPVSDLRNNFNEISELCRSKDEPVFVTRQGKGEMLTGLLELYQKLGEAEDLDASGDKGISHEEMMKRLKERIT